MGVFAGPEIVEDGLVLALDAGNTKSYPGSGTTWTDLSGNGNTGTLTNGPTYSSSNGGGIVFDGVDDYIDCGTNNNIKIDGGDFTIFSVFYIGNQTDAYGTFFYQSGDGAGNVSQKSIMFQRDGNNGITLNFYDGDSSGVTFTNGFISNTMVFVAVKFNRTTKATKFFRNGVFSNQITKNTAPSFTSLSSTQIGRRYKASAAFSVADLKGNSHLTMVYNRELTDAEIQQNFNATRGRFGI